MTRSKSCNSVMGLSMPDAPEAREASDVALQDERRETSQLVGASVISRELYEVAAAEIKLPARQTGVPMTYAIDGKQYIVLAAGDKNQGGELIALTLP